MIFKRIYDEQLAQASYLVGCAATGEALVIDPNRDVDKYLAIAAAEGVAITAVTETHIHADFVSGSRELAATTGAALYLSGEGTQPSPYDYAVAEGAVLVRDGDSIKVGNLKIDVLHTPGHTAEHLAFMLTDTPVADRPFGVFTGDFVFVGDVGRPDLLERAVGVSGTMEPIARTLFRSLQRFKQLPDYLQVWPGHGAGSACGKGLSAVPQSTIGYERIGNWAFQIEDEEEFVQTVLAGQPEPPAYFAKMARLNRSGPAVLGAVRRPDLLPDDRLAPVLASGATVVDTRRAAEFAVGHVPGTINIPLDRGFTSWAGWLVPYDADFYLIVDSRDGGNVDEAARELRRIGLDRVAGYFESSILASWTASGRALESLPSIGVGELAAKLAGGRVSVVDVRGRAEWQAGHLPGVSNIPVGFLVNQLAELPADRPLVVHCQSGARSAIAASVLQAHGLKNVVNLPAGYAGWVAAGQPVERAAELVAVVA